MVLLSVVDRWGFREQRSGLVMLLLLHFRRGRRPLMTSGGVRIRKLPPLMGLPSGHGGGLLQNRPEVQGSGSRLEPELEFRTSSEYQK